MPRCSSGSPVVPCSENASSWYSWLPSPIPRHRAPHGLRVIRRLPDCWVRRSRSCAPTRWLVRRARIIERMWSLHRASSQEEEHAAIIASRASAIWSSPFLSRLRRDHRDRRVAVCRNCSRPITNHHRRSVFRVNRASLHHHLRAHASVSHTTTRSAFRSPPSASNRTGEQILESSRFSDPLFRGGRACRVTSSISRSTARAPWISHLVSIAGPPCPNDGPRTLPV